MEDNTRVWIAKDNPGIARIEEKCIKCGNCKTVCETKVGIIYDQTKVKDPICVHCGQCVLTCPTGALIPKYDYKTVLNYLNDTNYTVIVSTSPAVRVALGDEFGFPPGSLVTGKMVEALRKLGFDYVFDVTFGADLTIMEETDELIKRINNNGPFPMFTSCCPAWVKYMEMYFPELIPYLSSTKSPIGMQGPAVKKYFCKLNNIDTNKVIHVCVTPCTAKKYEIKRPEITDVDYIITTSELSMMLRECGIEFASLRDSEFDKVLGSASGGGQIFGNTGGVMESALRTTYYKLTGSNPEPSFYTLSNIRAYDGAREAVVKIGDLDLKILVVHGIINLTQMKDKLKDYHFIEVMNCEGGCVGGGGQPLTAINRLEATRKERIKGLYQKDAESFLKHPHENPEIIDFYNHLKQRPEINKEVWLHTSYQNKAYLVQED
jgi:ferredoxin hydrogenase